MTKMLDASNALTEEISLPTDFAIAIMTGRTEFLKVIYRPLTSDETKMVVNAMAVLMETNEALKRHAEELGQKVEQLRGHAKGLINKIDQVYDMSQFREEMEYDGE